MTQSDSYSLKEMLQEVRDEGRDSSETLIKVNATLESINDHLSKLNSKVATHEKQLGELSIFRTQAMVVWGFGVVLVSTAANNILKFL